jgi:D-glycero-D-manno-heptose 1,7-bisphosphate phosphatase
LDLLIERLQSAGITRIVLLAGHLSEAVREAYASSSAQASADITILTEPFAAGTGGALKLALPELDTTFLVCNGDSYFDFPIKDFIASPPADGARIALRRIADAGRYGAVELDGSRIVGFREKTGGEPGIVNAGVYLMRRDLVESFAAPSSLEHDYFPALAQQGRLEGVVYDGYFLDIGVPESFAEGQRELIPRFGHRLAARTRSPRQ